MDNPQAFPGTTSKAIYSAEFDNFKDCMDKIKEIKVEENGMTLRDYFAGQAIQCAKWLGGADDVAKGAYGIADAMLKERSK